MLPTIDSFISVRETRSLEEYAKDLATSGVRVLPGSPGTFWAQHESGSMMRIPTFYLEPPAAPEVRRVLWNGHVPLASYCLEPDERHLANAWLYVCSDQNYALESLAPTVRRNVRRGLKELKIAPLTLAEMLTHGLQAFCDTRTRTGVSDGTPEGFHQYFEHDLPEQVYLGAWKGDQLAAFLTIREVDDWAELGCFSMNALLQYRPNDTLMYTALAHYLVKRRFRLVSYGLSSVQAESSAAGLHRFKTKIGFEARPVHRAFVPHPLLRPFANKAVHRGVNAALRLKPGDRRLKKAGGVLAYILGDTKMPDMTTGEEDS